MFDGTWATIPFNGSFDMTVGASCGLMYQDERVRRVGYDGCLMTVITEAGEYRFVCDSNADAEVFLLSLRQS